jgi:hypothetical protein
MKPLLNIRAKRDDNLMMQTLFIRRFKLPAVVLFALFFGIAHADLSADRCRPNALRTTAEVSHDQGIEERALRDKMADVIAAGLDYKQKGGSFNLRTYVEGLPIAVRRTFVYDFLQKQGSSAEAVSNIIARLDPVFGVREAVVAFLAQSPLLTEAKIAFAPEQIQRMFSGPRFMAFFPWFKGDAINLTVYPGEKLLLTVKTSPWISVEHGLDPRFLADGYMSRRFYDVILPRPVIRATVGYDPLVLPRMLVDEANADFHLDGMAQIDQVHGLTVQGTYEAGGNSLYVDFTARRGVADIENDIPKIRSALRKNMDTGYLSTLPEVESRLFAYSWAVNSSSNLIGSLRQTALRIAELEPDFTKLRIEIHSFPTRRLYDDVVKYREAYRLRPSPNPKTLAYLDQCVAELEGVLGFGANAKTLAAVVKGFKLPATVQTAVQALVKDFEKSDLATRLEKIENIRRGLRDLRQSKDVADRISNYDYYLIDREFAGVAMTAAKTAIENLPTGLSAQVNAALELGRQIIRQVTADEFLSITQREAYLRQLKIISSATGIGADRQLELISDLLGNTVDQVYYGLKRTYGEMDERILRLAAQPGKPIPVRFIDGTLRSNNVFMLSQLVDSIEESLMKAKNISHQIAGHSSKLPIRVFNPGEATGILRINKDAMELSVDEIGVFSEMPTESAALGGIVTIGTGAKLSHLQLLAKALKVPNIKGSPELLEQLKAFDGKMVHLSATKEGRVSINVVEAGKGSIASQTHGIAITIPVPNHIIDKPITFDNAAKYLKDNIAGPKGLTLTELRTDASLVGHVKDGFILPFGFFNRYLVATGIDSLVYDLGESELANSYVVAKVCQQIRKRILDTPIPKDMLAEVMQELRELKARTGHEAGYFFRSDTNIEDLPGFNGAGLNESVPNVAMEEADVVKAIQKVWASAFKEKSISWRGRALGATTVPIAEPSIVVLPTIFANSSGVIISRGTSHWLPGKGLISANWGIGSVVEAGAPVEEITLESDRAIRSSFTSSNVKPTAKMKGGIKFVPAEPGMPVLTDGQIAQLNQFAQKIEIKLGAQPHGYDIEWVIDTDGKLEIVQARPNM